MTQTQQSYQPTLTNKDFISLVNETSKSLNLTLEESKMVINSQVARFVAEIPFICSQKEPEQKAVLSLIILVSAKRNKALYASKINQSILERVSLCVVGQDGDQELLKACKTFLTLASLEDHKYDLEDDIKNNYPNPLRNTLDFDTEKARLFLSVSNMSNETRSIIDEKGFHAVAGGIWM